MIKILIVDDSLTEIALIQHIIDSAPDMSVIGIAHNGQEAIALAAKLKPDLITMDIQMPIMDGLEATRIIMSENPTPIIVISSLIKDESVSATFPIMEAGALTAIAKPVNIFSTSFVEQSNYILATIRSMVEIRVMKKTLNKSADYSKKLPHIELNRKNTHYELLAIGASVGGPIALKIILSQLPANFPLPIVIVQHMSNGFIRGFTQWLARNISLKVKMAINDEPLEPGTVYVAPEQKHLEIKREHKKLLATLIDNDSSEGFCPSINILLESIAKVLGKKAIGMLLTGMSDDGAIGLLELKNAHGHTLIQDRESSVVFGMGAVAQSLHAVDEVLDLKNIASYLTSICMPET